MIKFSVKHPVSITMLISILLALGFISMTKIGLDFFPKMDYPAVTVVTQYTNVSPEDIENLITKPVESAVSTVNGVKKVTSYSQEGMSVVSVEFNWGTNLDFAAQDIRDKLGLIEDYLPAEASKPIVVKFSMSDLPVMEYVATSDRYSTRELKDILNDQFKNTLERIDGVGQCAVAGGRERQYWINIDLSKIVSYGIDLNQVIKMIGMNNLNLPVGKIVNRHKEFLIRTIGQYQNERDIGNAVIGYTKRGNPIFVKDIGKVVKTINERNGYVKLGTKEAVGIDVTKQSNANTVTVVGRVKKVMKKLEQKYPSIKFTVTFDQARFIRLATSRTTNSALIGALLAALLILIFLLDWRPTLIISLAIPLSVIITFIVIYFAGYTFNMITLMGIALGVGMLVDASVVVIENIFRHTEMGEDKKTAAINGTEEVWLAISASTFTNIIVFFPLIYVGGITGKIATPLAVTVSITLLASLFVAVTIIPMLASQIMSLREAKKEATHEYWFTPVRETYRKLLGGFILRNKTLVVLSSIVLFVLSIVAVKWVGIEFMPKMDRTFGMLQVELPPGTSLKETENYLDQLTDIAGIYREVDYASTMAGVIGNPEQAAFSMGGVGSNKGTLFLQFKDSRKRSSYQIIQDMLNKLPQYKGAKIKSVDMSKMMMGTQNALQVNVYGYDLGTLASISKEIMAKIETIPGVYLPDISLKNAKPEYKVIIDRQKAAYYGISPVALQNELDIAFNGKLSTRLSRSGKEYDVIVKLDSAYTGENLSRLSMYPVKTAMGSYIPLNEIAKIKYGLGPVQIDREKQSRVAYITGDSKGRSTGRVMMDIEKALSNLKLPTGYSIEFAGEMQQISDMMKDMVFALFAAILLVYMIMAAQFESFKDPFIVMFSLPLAIIGVVAAFLITGVSISLPSLMGTLILMGVAVNEAIVMITLIKQLREQGIPDHEAVVQGASIRLRPVMISGLTTVIGMLPMALVAHKHGAEMRQPMAIAMIGGLLTAIVLTLIVIPVIYEIFEKIKYKKPK